MRWYLATHEAVRARQRERDRARRRTTGLCVECGRERQIETRGWCRTCYEHWRYARRPELREAENARTRERMRRVRAERRAAEPPG